MSLTRSICSRLGIDDQPLVMTPMMCRRVTKNRGVVDELHVAYLVIRNDRTVLEVYPGVTGHESFYMMDATSRLNESERAFVPEPGIFGPTRWEDQPWSLCAGSNVYDELSVAKGELRQAITRLLKIRNGRGAVLAHCVVPQPDAGSDSEPDSEQSLVPDTQDNGITP